MVLLLPGAVLLAIFAAGHLLLVSQDYNRVKGLLEQAVSDASGRDFRINGELGLSFSLTPELIVSDATLANAEWGSVPDMVKIGRLDVRLELLPLLRGEIRFRNIELIDSSILLEISATGEPGWLLVRNDMARAEQAFRRLGMQQLDIERLTVTLHRAGTDSTDQSWYLDHLVLSRMHDTPSLAVVLAGDINEQALSLTGTIGQLRDLFAGTRYPIALSGELGDTQLSVTGSIANALQLDGIDLDVEMSGDDLSGLGVLPGTRLPPTRRFSLSAHLAGDRQVIAARQLAGSFDTAGITFAMTGRIGDLRELDNIQLDITGHGHDLAGLGRILDRPLPASGPFSVSGEISGNRSALALANARGRISGRHYRLDLAGTIDDILNLEGIALQVDGAGSDLARLGRAVDRPLPAGPFSISGEISGNRSALALANAQGSITGKDFQLELAGSIDDLLNLEGLNLQVKGTGSNLAKLGPLRGQPLPKTGPWSASGKLTGNAKAPALRSAHGQVSRNHVSLSVTGRVGDLLELKGIDLHCKVSGRSLADIEDLFRSTLPRSGAFTARGRLTGAPGRFRLADLNADIRHEQVTLTASGSIGDPQKLRDIRLDVAGSGKEFADLGALFGARLPELGAFAVRGKLQGSQDRLDITGLRIDIDNSDFSGTSRITFGDEPAIRAELDAGLIDVTRLMDHLQDERHHDNSTVRHEGKAVLSGEPLPFDLLAAVDAHVSVQARNVRARDAALEFGKLTLHLDDGVLRIAPLEATYKTTRLSATLEGRAGPPARVAGRLLVQGLDIGELLRESGVSAGIDAKIDIAADLQSLGASTRRLVANLDGVFAVVIGKGKVPHYLDFLAEDLSRRLIPLWGQRHETGKLNCGVAQFDIRQGVASSSEFLFDTEIGSIRGQGNIELATGQIDFMLSPRPKKASLFSLQTDVRITGRLADPVVRADKKSLIGKGAKSLSTLVVGPAGLLAPFVSLGADSKHPCDMQAMLRGLERIYE